jgi:cystathionine gamma-synthase
LSTQAAGGGGPGRHRSIATAVVHAGQHPDESSGSLSPPLLATSTFLHGNAGGYEYGRERNPTWERLETAICALEEGAAATVFSSGMATISAIVEAVPVGAAVVAAHNSYSGTRWLLSELQRTGRVEVRLVDIADTQQVSDAADGAALVCLESLTNPQLTIPDLTACIESAHGAAALIMVDNTFATPLTLQPLTLGADIVVHSLTKYVGGHSDLILGAAVVRDPRLAATLADWRHMAGSIPGQLECWLALRGMRTLAVRVQRQMDNALHLAQRLEKHRAVDRVHYPGLTSHPHHQRAAAQMRGGFGAVVSIEVRGGAERAEAMCQAASLWSHTTSLGGVHSTLERRARYPLDAGVVPASLVRLSVGIEDVDDLYDDLDRALAVSEPLAAAAGA